MKPAMRGDVTSPSQTSRGRRAAEQPPDPRYYGYRHAGAGMLMVLNAFAARPARVSL
jgi:hypothetical protein